MNPQETLQSLNASCLLTHTEDVFMHASLFGNVQYISSSLQQTLKTRQLVESLLTSLLTPSAWSIPPFPSCISSTSLNCLCEVSVYG